MRAQTFFKCLVSNYTSVNKYHPLEVLRRDGETQLQVSDFFTLTARGST